MIESCNSFVLSSEVKSVKTLWLEFKEALITGIKKFIPVALKISRIPQSIRRETRQEDRSYQRLKRSKTQNRRSFLNSKQDAKRKINLAYDKYLEDILGLNDETGNQPFCRKICLAS